jgi:hypothetical protein
MELIVARSYPVSAITEAAARKKPETLRFPRVCWGIRRGAVDECEDTLTS